MISLSLKTRVSFAKEPYKRDEKKRKREKERYALGAFARHHADRSGSTRPTPHVQSGQDP